MESLEEIPKLRISPRIKPPESFDPGKESVFHYEAKAHKLWPHVVKFSGGKTSGMMLFILLKTGLLRAERGDVVIFNNTSAEHPATYEFAKRCKRIVEKQYGIPFFWVEHQTYEDARQGEYTRLSSFRLVNDEPYSEKNPIGYHCRGEVFEELLSFKGYVPTVFQRICTQSLKLETSRFFLREWLANKEKTERLGHFGETSRMDDDDMYERHLRNGGEVPRDVFMVKKAFLKQCRLARESQKWSDYSGAVVPFANKELEGKAYGRKAHFGEGGIEYVSFVGLRYDEMNRVQKMRRRNADGSDSENYEGEHVYTPLAGMKITEEDVQEFWDKRTWGLALKKEDNLSNCTFCFLKGIQKLEAVRQALEREHNHAQHAGTPCDIRWWAEVEDKYGRDMIAEKRETKSLVEDDFIGFFGASGGRFYKRLAAGSDEFDPLTKGKLPCGIAPCDCTD